MSVEKCKLCFGTGIIEKQGRDPYAHYIREYECPRCEGTGNER